MLEDRDYKEWRIQEAEQVRGYRTVAKNLGLKLTRKVKGNYFLQIKATGGLFEASNLKTLRCFLLAFQAGVFVARGDVTEAEFGDINRKAHNGLNYLIREITDMRKALKDYNEETAHNHEKAIRDVRAQLNLHKKSRKA